jgi:hypothetical protein
MKKNEIYSIAEAVQEKYEKKLETLAEKMVKDAARKFSKKFGEKSFIEKSGNGFTSSQDWLACGIILEGLVDSWVGAMMSFARMSAISKSVGKEFKKETYKGKINEKNQKG